MASTNASLRTVAAIEALKGLTVLIAAAGLMAVIHENAQMVAEEIVRHFHLNPANRYPRIFLDVAASLNSTRLWLLAGGASLYSGARGVEAYGLWHGRVWAEWFGMLSAGLYIPFEVFELTRGVTWIRVSLLVINILTLALLSWGIYSARKTSGSEIS
jgi:uncharacterized membrane protein (DUF2068 family)